MLACVPDTVDVRPGSAHPAGGGRTAMDRQSASRNTSIHIASDHPGPALAWSGGKDGAMALHIMGSASLLLTTDTERYERISTHGVRRSLLRAQAQAVGLPVLEVPSRPSAPTPCTRPDGGGPGPPGRARDPIGGLR